MNMHPTEDPQFEIINFLYQYKDDNKFYKLHDHLLKIATKKEKYVSIFKLRDNAFIATDSEVYYNAVENSIAGHFTNPDEIGVKILPKGIVAVESMLEKSGCA